MPGTPRRKQVLPVYELTENDIRLFKSQLGIDNVFLKLGFALFYFGSGISVGRGNSLLLFSFNSADLAPPHVEFSIKS
jgi:hypothetical protein